MLTKLDIFGTSRPRDLVVTMLLLCSVSAFGQRESGDIRHGNRDYKKQDYTAAEVDYRRALETNKDSYEAHYNLGDALFKQDKYTDAQAEFETAAKMLDKKSDKDHDNNAENRADTLVHHH